MFEAHGVHMLDYCILNYAGCYFEQVTVLDVNDNAPVFPDEEFEVLVKENSAVGTVVAQITATDPDEGANAQIMYQVCYYIIQFIC